MRSTKLYRARNIVAVLALASIALFAWAIGNARDTNLLMLQSCMEVETKTRAWICKQLLYRLPPTQAELEELNSSAGAQFPASMADINEATELLRHYLRAGLDINAVDKRTQLKWTALHSAAFEGNVQAIQLLTTHGADINARDAMDRTPLDLVRSARAELPPGDYENMLSMLISKQDTKTN